MLHVSLLGPVEVRRDGTIVPIAGGKTAEVLVRLALDAGTVVRTDRLIEELWADDAVNTRRNTLQSKIAKLRRALGEPQVVLSRDDGYVLDVDPSEVDALAVLDDAVATARLVAEGDDRRAADLAMSALSRLSGELIPAAQGEWATAHRARLEAARAALLDAAFGARVRVGDDADVIGDLEAAVDAHPFQEHLWELLMTALYRAGRQADALAAYQRARLVLAEQLGLDPGERLQELEQQILTHAAALRGAASASADALTTNLPALAAELVGRDDEVAAIRSRLADERLVTLVGPGGVGKTALAVETGRQLRASGDFMIGGVWLVRLETATTAGEVVDAVIAAVGVAGGEPALLDRLRSNATLLVLDNCEHLVEPIADLAVRVLDAGAATRILATSQVPLDVDGESTVEIAPLSLVHAIELFGLRTATHGRHRSGDDTQVEELCRSLDGLPLAIELAAARTKTLSVSDIARRLDDRIDVLSDPASRRSERRRALRSTIAWSYDLLFPDDQKGLWALSTFAGGASLAATEHVLQRLGVPASTTIDVIGRLAGRSLLITDDDGATGSVRYRLLDSIRAFARDAMTDAGLLDDALDAHAEWFATAAAVSTDGVRGREQAEYLTLASSERANIDAALAWSATHDPPRALAIALGFGWAWIVLGDSRGAERLLAALAANEGHASPRDRAAALLLAGWIEASLGDLDAARTHIATGQVLADELADVDLQARAACYLAYVVSHEAQWQHALDLTDRSAQLYDTIDRPWDQAVNALFAARAAIGAGDAVRATATCESVRHWLQAVEDPWLRVRGEAIEGELARVEHRFDDAVAHLDRAARASGALGFRQTEAYQLSSLGRAHCQAGDYPTGIATLDAALTKAEAIGDVRLSALIRVHLGRVLRAAGRRDDARIALTSATTWHRAAGGGEQAALGECLLAALDAVDGETDAEDRLTELLREARARDDAPVEVLSLDALARIAADSGDTTRARDLASEAARRMVDASHFITELDRVDAEAMRQLT